MLSSRLFREGLRSYLSTTKPLLLTKGLTHKLHQSFGRTIIHSSLNSPWSISAVRLSGVWLIANKNPLIGVCKNVINLTRNYSNDENYRRTNPVPEKDDNDPHQPPEGWTWYQILPGVLVAILYYLASNSEHIPEVPFPFFLQHMLQTGEVAKIDVNSSRDHVYIHLHPGAIINGREVKPYGPQFMMSIAGVDSFENKIAQAQDEMGIPQNNRLTINYRTQSDTLAIFVSGLATLAIFGAVWYFLFYKTGFGGSAGSGGARGSSPFNPFSFMVRAKTTIITDPSQIGTQFTEVAGMAEAKAEVMEFVDYLKSPTRFTDLGARIPKGALLHGPPGTGKTLLARAIASEASVPFISIAGPDFVEMFAGVGSARVRDLFGQARKNAPCILYIDEIDAVGKSRQSGPAVEGTSEQENTLNQILVEMDGINPLEGVVVLASTNRVDILDKALLRPGRFDRQIAIDLPTLPERKAIFEVYLRRILLERPLSEYSSRLAALTPGHSGADIANIVNEAALHAAREKGTKVTERNFEYAIERIIAGMKKKNSTLSSEERKKVAYHEAGHAVVGWLLEHTDPIMKVSIVPRTKGPLGFAQYLPSDQKLYTREQLFDRMCMTLGGRAAEAIFFRQITTGARDDLEKVTNMAYRQITEFGMSPTIGHISLPQSRSTEPTKRFYSNKLAKMIDEEARSLVNSAYSRAETILKENQEKVEKLAECLLEKEVLNYKDLVEILGSIPHQKTYHHYQDLEDMCYATTEG